jgi:hypothetical protein
MMRALFDIRALVISRQRGTNRPALIRSASIPAVLLPRAFCSSSIIMIAAATTAHAATFDGYFRMWSTRKQSSAVLSIASRFVMTSAEASFLETRHGRVRRTALPQPGRVYLIAFLWL